MKGHSSVFRSVNSVLKVKA